jgi:hypothetical protein
MISTTIYYVLAEDNMVTCNNHYVVIFRPLKYIKLSVISSFYHKVGENCAFLGCYTE